jgi:zinc protease
MQLENGLTVFVVPKATSAAQVTLVVRHIGAADSTSRLELGKQTLALLTRTNHARSALSDIEELGGWFATAVDAGRSSLSLTVLSRDVPQAMSVLAELATKAAGHTRAVTVGDLPDANEAASRESLLRFHEQNYSPRGAALIIVGNTTLEGLTSTIQDRFGTWRASQNGSPLLSNAHEPTEEPSLSEKPKVVIADAPGAQQSTIRCWFPQPPRNAPGQEAREVLAFALGGSFGSRLNQSLREKSAYAYRIDTRLVSDSRSGALYIELSAATNSTGDVIRQLLRELAAARDPRLGRPFSEQETERAKSGLLHSVDAAWQQGDRLVDLLGQAFAAGLPPNYYARYAEQVRLVDSSAVANEAARLLPGRLRIVIAGDRSQLAAELHDL